MNEGRLTLHSSSVTPAGLLALGVHLASACSEVILRLEYEIFTADSMGCFGKRETEEEKDLRRRNKKIDEQIKNDKQKYKATHRLLLLG